MKISISTSTGGHPLPYFDDEPELRSWLLQALLMDCDGQEELYLGELAKGEAGETILDLYNNFIHLYIYPDLVVLEDMSALSLWNGEGAEEPRSCMFLSPAAARQLILDWLEAKRQWYAEKRRLAVN